MSPNVNRRPIKLLVACVAVAILIAFGILDQGGTKARGAAGGASAGASAPVDFQKDPRWMLIQMLFGLVIAAIAQQSARLVALRKDLKEVYPIVAHLVLVTSVVTTSWVGWNRAEAREDPIFHLSDVFGPLILSVPFVLLLIDIALVTCYFIMADGVEIPSANEQ